MSRFKLEGDLHTWENAISVTFGEHLCARVPSRIRTGESVAVKVPVQCSEVSVAPRGFEQVTKGCAYLDDQPVGLLADWYLVLTQINSFSSQAFAILPQIGCPVYSFVLFPLNIRKAY